MEHMSRVTFLIYNAKLSCARIQGDIFMLGHIFLLNEIYFLLEQLFSVGDTTPKKHKFFGPTPGSKRKAEVVFVYYLL